MNPTSFCYPNVNSSFYQGRTAKVHQVYYYPFLFPTSWFLLLTYSTVAIAVANLSQQNLVNQTPQPSLGVLETPARKVGTLPNRPKVVTGLLPLFDRNQLAAVYGRIFNPVTAAQRHL